MKPPEKFFDRKVLVLKRLTPLLLILLLGPGFPALGAEVSEYTLKSAYLLNFAQSVHWPKSAFSDDQSPIVVGILGEDPFGGKLDDALKGKSAHGRPLAVKRFTNFDPKRSEDLGGCQILFIAESEQDHISEILSALQDYNLLTVSEIDQFPSLGGMILFDKEGDQISLVVNPKAAKKAGLKLSSDLLQLSKIYPKVDSEKVKALYYQGIQLYVNGQFKEAIRIWKECLEEDPGNSTVLGSLQKAKLKLRLIKKLSNESNP